MFVHFTNLLGQSVPIRPDQVGEIRPPYPHEMDKGANAVLILGGGFQAVRETVAQCEALLDRA